MQTLLFCRFSFSLLSDNTLASNWACYLCADAQVVLLYIIFWLWILGQGPGPGEGRPTRQVTKTVGRPGVIVLVPSPWVQSETGSFLETWTLLAWGSSLSNCIAGSSTNEPNTFACASPVGW